VLGKEQIAILSEKAELGFWEHMDEKHTIMRIATSWATTLEDASALAALLHEHNNLRSGGKPV
jgi:threonine aldolase